MSHDVHGSADRRNNNRWIPLSDLGKAYPEAPGYKVTGTSSEAAEAIADHARTAEKLLLRQFREAPDGLTPDEASARAGISILSGRPRCTILKRLGLLTKTEDRRPNESGLSATVLKATPKAFEGVS